MQTILQILYIFCEDQEYFYKYFYIANSLHFKNLFSKLLVYYLHPHLCIIKK